MGVKKIKRFYGDLGTIISEGVKSQNKSRKAKKIQGKIKRNRRAKQNDQAAIDSVIGGSSAGAPTVMDRYRAASAIASDASNFNGTGVKKKKKKPRN